MSPYKIRLRAFITCAGIISIVAYYISTVLFGTPAFSILLNPSSILFALSTSWLLFDKYLWKSNIAKICHLRDFPDLNGTWVGKLDRTGENNPHFFEMSIVQTFSKLSIKTKTKSSTGETISSTFLTDGGNNNFSLLNYWACRTKKRDGSGSLENFHGLSLITIDYNPAGEIILRDYYFTNRNPSTEGETILKRKKQKISLIKNKK